MPLPSAMPTFLLSTMPTASPTGFECTYTEGTNDMDATRYLTLARPVIKVSSGTAYALTPTQRAQDSPSRLFKRDFGFFNAGVPPGSAFNFKVGIAGKQVDGGPGGDGTTIEARAQCVTIALKTKSIYSDSRRVQVVF